MQSTLLIFLDGVGIGKNDPEENPFFRKEYKFLNGIFKLTPSLENQILSADSRFLFPIDANMGIEGLPQSGTGQTSIFCGINAPQVIGKHFGPYPFSSLKPIITKENIFRAFQDLELSVTFANAFPQIFFDYINSGRKRLNVTTLMALESKVKMFGINELIEGEGISSDITNRRWNTKMGYNISEVTPEDAAKRLLKIAKQRNFTLFEYFFTDHLGHGRNKDDFDRFMTDLDRFLFEIISNINDKLTLLICSDHGNIENTRVKGHTNNPTLAITAGYKAEELKNKISNLSDIKAAILSLY